MTENKATPPTPGPGQVQIENISLEEFERLVYSRKHEAAGAQLLATLRRLKMGAEFIGYPTDSRVRPALYSRLAAAIIALFADEKFGLSYDGFDHLASEHAILDLLFRASVFETSDHLLPQLAANPKETDRTKLKLADGPGIAKFLMTYSLRSSFALNFEQTFKRAPKQFAALWAGMCSALLTVSKQAHERHEVVLALHEVFKGVEISDGALATLSDAYMYTSYATSPNKHDAKATIHSMFSAAMRKRSVPVPKADAIALRRRTRDTRDKPVMLVGVEWFTSLHAMYRCYAPVIRQLRKRFHLVAISRPSDIDEIGKAEFDEWYPIDQQQIVLRVIAEKINEIRPDIIYWPSLGMALWWVALASERFAPIQVMSLGHPASSRSPAIDYVLTDRGAIGNAELFSETIVTYPNTAARFVMRPDAVFPAPEWDDDPSVVHVAIPAMLCKLNAPFMAALRDIHDKTTAEVRFHFFVNMRGLNLYQAAREIRDWLPDALVYENAHYNDYLRHMNRCHLHFSTFPFGGTNSIIDSLLLGIPVLTLEGEEPHSRFDAILLRQAGLDEFLVAKSVMHYVEAGVQLIDNAGLRNNYHNFLRDRDLQAIFFAPPEGADADTIGDIMWAIYCDHEKMKASGLKLIDGPLWIEAEGLLDFNKMEGA